MKKDKLGIFQKLVEENKSRVAKLSDEKHKKYFDEISGQIGNELRDQNEVDSGCTPSKKNKKKD